MKAEIAGKLLSQMGSVGNQPENETTVLAMLCVTFSESVPNLSCYNPTTPLLATKRGKL
jgi:hypothetical protein